MDHDALGRLAAATDTAMVVVTAAMEGAGGWERAGCLVGFHSQSSIDPPRYAVWLSKANHTYRVALFGDHLAVHFLGEADLELAKHFGTVTGDEDDKFGGWEWQPGPGGVPLLVDCANRLVIRRDAVFDSGGDHVSFSGDVVEASTAEESFVPLRFDAVAGLDAAHPAEERPRPPTERAG